MRERIIEAPAGFKIKSVSAVDGKAIISFEEIVKELPKTLEETIPYIPDVCYYIDSNGYIDNTGVKTDKLDPNTLTSEEYAEAFLALMQLIRFRDIWNGDWKPNWDERNIKYIIYVNSDTLVKESLYHARRVLSFKTPELRDKFSETFGEFIIKAKPLL